MDMHNSVHSWKHSSAPYECCILYMTRTFLIPMVWIFFSGLFFFFFQDECIVFSNWKIIELISILTKIVIKIFFFFFVIEQPYIISVTSPYLSDLEDHQIFHVPTDDTPVKAMVQVQQGYIITTHIKLYGTNNFWENERDLSAQTGKEWRRWCVRNTHQPIRKPMHAS